MGSISSIYQQISNHIKIIDLQDDEGILETISSDNNTSILNRELLVSLNAESQGTLFVPFLGQSNAEHMSIIYDPYQPGSVANETSGAIVLDLDLTNLTGSNVVTSDARETNFAVGGSKVNGNAYYQDPEYIWWYPNENRPGGALLQAEQGLKQWLIDGGARSTDEIAIVWSQGESDVGDITPSDPSTKEKYKESTLAVFDYLKNNLGYDNVTFYLVPTGRFQSEGGFNVGLNPQEIDSINQGTAIVRNTQSEIALERDDVQLAPDYSDLNMVYEEGQIYGGSYDLSYDRWSRDFWHLGHDGLKVNGSRLAQYIALDRGQNNVISFTDSFGNPAESISLSRDGILDLNIAENSSQGVIRGTDNPDVIVGSLGVDEITGGVGNDVIIASQGIDTLTGGAGRDIFFYDSLVYENLNADGDRIVDFELGSDRIDLAELLNVAGYRGNDPIGDGYVVVNCQSETSLEILFDADGVGGQTANTLAILENIDSPGFQNDLGDRFVFIPTEY
ncbi:type I secretion C-terminal target domain-containing protein [Waterburya agarophytonicola K14]|uniref:Type I secretion C-terminal target domain-containing protein n=1 Tax=Waterburya agarophytonicola KI4 TaxID=2874699 RepID=A0A964BQP2_9CYAN|nr:type I secretion C-terminal target domain-containing protein [Waterburya agarophytonicola]MCC0177066.1 type I secretion C-terminal target domain-containing protein [Waterburya agarophytonicola KI4]